MRRCDRARAREARHIINSHVRPLIRYLQADMLSECPFHADHDFLLPHEEEKQVVAQWQWRCGICGKVFRTEHHLDRHFDRRHSETLQMMGNTCLGDFCDILRCPSWLEAMRMQRPEHGVAHDCNPAELQARRHQCQHIMHDCFAASGGAEVLNPVFETMDERFCSLLTCSRRERLRDLSTAIHESHENGHGASHYILGGLLIAALLVLYTAIYCWYSETTRAGDRALQARQHRALGIISWLGNRRKRKAY